MASRRFGKCRRAGVFRRQQQAFYPGDHLVEAGVIALQIPPASLQRGLVVGELAAPVLEEVAGDRPRAPPLESRQGCVRFAPGWAGKGTTGRAASAPDLRG